MVKFAGLFIVYSIFFVVPGGFVVACLNFRLRQVCQNLEMEGLNAGFFTAIVYTLITLFLTIVSTSKGFSKHVGRLDNQRDLRFRLLRTWRLHLRLSRTQTLRNAHNLQHAPHVSGVPASSTSCGSSSLPDLQKTVNIRATIQSLVLPEL
jgi:hypothetical protein